MIDLTTITLRHGKHPSRDDGTCIMEAAAWLAGEPHSDHPVCVCPVIATFARRVNDCMPDDATRTRLLAPLLPRLIGTAGDPAASQRRAYIAADLAVRVFAPDALDAAGLTDHGARLRALPPIVDQATATRATYAADAAAVAAAKSAAAADATYAAYAAWAAANAAANVANAAAAVWAAAAAAVWAAADLVGYWERVPDWFDRLIRADTGRAP
jgi:hypothetical protein